MAYHLPQHTISAHAIHTQERNDCNSYATYTNKMCSNIQCVDVISSETGRLGGAYGAAPPLYKNSQ